MTDAELEHMHRVAGRAEDEADMLRDEAAELRATIARLDAQMRYFRDMYRKAVGLPTTEPGACPTCGSKKP